MKLLFSILGLITAIIAVILSILPMEKIAVIPAVSSIIFALIALFLSKNESKKLIKFIFVVSGLSIAIISYKSFFSSESKIIKDEIFIEKNQESEENALEELEDLEELDDFEELDSISQ